MIIHVEFSCFRFWESALRKICARIYLRKKQSGIDNRVPPRQSSISFSWMLTDYIDRNTNVSTWSSGERNLTGFFLRRRRRKYRSSKHLYNSMEATASNWMLLWLLFLWYFLQLDLWITLLSNRFLNIQKGNWRMMALSYSFSTVYTINAWFVRYNEREMNSSQFIFITHRVLLFKV